MRVERASADVQDGPLRRGNGLSSGRDLTRMAAAGRFPSREGNGLRVGEIEFGFLDVARDVDENRTAAAGAGDVERRLQRVRKLFDVLDEPRVLDDRDRDAGDV